VSGTSARNSAILLTAVSVFVFACSSASDDHVGSPGGSSGGSAATEVSATGATGGTSTETRGTGGGTSGGSAGGSVGGSGGVSTGGTGAGGLLGGGGGDTGGTAGDTGGSGVGGLATGGIGGDTGGTAGDTGGSGMGGLVTGGIGGDATGGEGASGGQDPGSGGAAGAGGPRTKLNINPVWKYYLGTPSGTPQDTSYDDSLWEDISLPHTLQEASLNLDNANDSNYQNSYHRLVGWYRKELELPADALSKRIFLEFQGVMQVADVYVNGNLIGTHAVSGFDSFHYDITDTAVVGRNIIAVRVDNTVNENTPPDGQTKDFILFGGIYRDVFLVITEPLYVNFPWETQDAGIRITTSDVSESSATVRIDTTVRNVTGASADCTVTTEIRDIEDNLVETLTSTETIPNDQALTITQAGSPISNPNLWSPDSPYLYKAVTTISDGAVDTDRMVTRFGIRWFGFSDSGFSLNGRQLELVGTNRHQTWPFVGNAVPNEIHRRDAELMKAMGVNWLRLSHYPHDPDFLDDLDELGIMALEEGPTWMDEGNPTWMNNLEESFRSMIRRDRNHPSIVIWNACINHQGCNSRLGNASSEEDATRPRGACDVPTPMDFSHGSISGGGALTIEHTGHTFPAARGSGGEYEEAVRHMEMTNASYLKSDNNGLASWCGFDYNTFHNTNEPNMVHHGVLDLMRIPKYSYYWHISELTDDPMAYIVKHSDSGVTVYSNCEQVSLYEGDTLVETRSPDSGYALNHPPFSFSVNGSANHLRADCLVGGEVRAQHEWRRPGTASRLAVEADRSSIHADGSDFSRIIVSVVDADGTVVSGANDNISFEISGPGRLIGDNPVRPRAGSSIVLAASNSLQTGSVTITASASGLTSGSVDITVNPIPDGYYVPGATFP
jgi:beta-galactosidase